MVRWLRGGSCWLCYLQGTVKYLVLWKGFGPEESSWEPAANLIGCDAAVSKFEKSRAVAAPPQHPARAAVAAVSAQVARAREQQAEDEVAAAERVSRQACWY